MKSTDQVRFAELARESLTPFVKTFAELSKTDGSKKPFVNTCFKVGRMKAFSFDEIIRRWRTFIPPCVCPSSVDAIYPFQERLFFVEFKRKPISSLLFLRRQLVKKLYDSLFTIAERGITTLAECRLHVVYIIVATIAEEDIRKQIADRKRPPRFDVASLFSEINDQAFHYMEQPWLQSIALQQILDLRNLKDVCCRDVFVLTVEQFDRFAEANGWE